MNTTSNEISDSGVSSPRGIGINEIVIVDPACDRYPDFVQAARSGDIGLHFCCDGRAAVRLARRFRADVWLVATELSDMSGFDLLDMLAPHVCHADVDPTLSGAPISLGRVGDSLRSAVFMVSSQYRLEEEQRSLASGVAGYLVRPVMLDTIRSIRSSLHQNTVLAGAFSDAPNFLPPNKE